MHTKQLFFLGFTATIFLLLSNANGVPQAVTKAPGEVNHNSCGTCHTPAGNYVPSIGLEITDNNQSQISRYQLGQTYNIKLKVSATNSPKSFGFQMTCLDSLTNSDKGVWSSMGEKVRQQILTVQQKQRVYLVQSAPKSDGIFTVKWKAPDTNIGPIKFYFAGLAINQSNNTTGDNHVTGQLTLQAPTTSTTNEQQKDKYIVFPNPASDIVYVPEQCAETRIFSTSGNSFSFNPIHQQINVQSLPTGHYILQLMDKSHKLIHTKRFIKL